MNNICTVKSGRTDSVIKFVRQRKPFHLILGVALMTMLLAACGTSGNTPSTGTPAGGTTPAPGGGKGCTKVGVLLPETASSARWESKDKPLLTQKIQAIAGVTVDYYNAQGDEAQQQNQADAALSKGDCILVVAPHDANQAASIVGKAKARNVPVIAYDRLIQSKDLNFYVSFDAVAVGELQGQYIVDHYQNYIRSNNNVALINGSPTDSNALLIRRGAANKLKPLFDSRTLTLVFDQFTPGGNPDRARTEMEAVLTAKQNNLQIAYVANDDMANSVIAALKARNLNGKILVTGQDATIAGLQNILTGNQAMTVYKSIDKETQATADLIRALHDGTDPQTVTKGATVMTADGAAIPSVLESPVAVDKTNIQTTVIADNFVTLAEICNGLPTGTNTNGLCP